MKKRYYLLLLVLALLVGGGAGGLCAHRMVQGRSAQARAAARSFAPVELLYQAPELPNGCEVTSLAMVLAAAGEPIDKTELYRGYMPSEPFSYDGSQNRHGPSPEQAFAGDAGSAKNGWYCLEGPVVQAANAWLGSRGSSLQAVSLTGLRRDELMDCAAAGTPLVVWVTQDYQAPAYNHSFTWLLPTGQEYLPYSNLHCVVLIGLSADGLLFRVADPIRGRQNVPTAALWASFDAMGRRAVAIR